MCASAKRKDSEWFISGVQIGSREVADGRNLGSHGKSAVGIISTWMRRYAARWVLPSKDELPAKS